MNLTDQEVLDTLGIDAEGLVRADHSFTRQIGDAAHERQFQAIRSPSATGADHVLAVFPENLGAATLTVELVQVWQTEQDL